MSAIDVAASFTGTGLAAVCVGVLVALGLAAWVAGVADRCRALRAQSAAVQVQRLDQEALTVRQQERAHARAARIELIAAAHEALLAQEAMEQHP